MRILKNLVILALLALASVATASDLAARTELAIAEFKTKFYALFNGVDAASCSYKADGASFDWSSMSGKTFEGGNPTDQEHYAYKITMCGVSSDPECAKDNQGSICQYDKWSNNKYVSALGSFTMNPAPTFSLIKADDPNAGVEAYFQNAGDCGPSW